MQKLPIRGAEVMKEAVIKGKKGDIFMGKMSFVKNLRKLPRCHIIMLWGRKMNNLAKGRKQSCSRPGHIYATSKHVRC